MRTILQSTALVLLALCAACADATAPRTAADARDAGPSLNQFSGVNLTVQSPVGPFETCVYIAQPVGGSGPFEYEWFINLSSVGPGDWPGNLYWTNDGNSHSVRVVVTETSTNTVHTARGYVTVGSGAGPCFQ